MATGSSNGDVSCWLLDLLARTLFTGVVLARALFLGVLFLRADAFFRAALFGVDDFFVRRVFVARFFPARFPARFFELARDVFFFVGIGCKSSTAAPVATRQIPQIAS